ncbi:MAG: MlaD family protein [Actinomycetota bacterium]|nr:MlaD family protein [Actinomycetota bacterium]
MAAFWRGTRTFVAVTVVLAGMFFGVKARYGSYGDYYYLTVDIPRAGQLMRVDADVRERGVIIGSVSDIRLVNHEAQLTLQIQSEFRVPVDAVAVVDLKTLLGDKFVDLRFEEYAPPFLKGGERIPGIVGPELEDVVQSGVDVLAALNPDDAASVIHELAEASRGRSEDIARGLDANAELSGTFASTLEPQLRGLRAFHVIFGELRDVADDLNELADAVNEGVPIYASPRAHAELRRVLELVVPMADDLADLLILNRRDWDRMMDSGDVVLQTIASRPRGLHDLVHGAFRYVFKLGHPPPKFGDGREMAPFVALVGGEEESRSPRDADAPDSPGNELVSTIRTLCEVLPAEKRRDIYACEVVMSE